MRYLAIVVLLVFAVASRAQETKPIEAPKPKLEKAWLTLSALGYAATIADTRATMHDRSGSCAIPPCRFVEHDPIERPIVHLPQPAYYSIRIGETTFANFLGWKMKHSTRWYRHIWWAPQGIAIFGGTWGAAYSSANHR